MFVRVRRRLGDCIVRTRRAWDLQRFLAPMLFTHTSSLGSSTSYPPSVKLLNVMRPGNALESLQLNGRLNCVPSSLFTCTMR